MGYGECIRKHNCNNSEFTHMVRASTMRRQVRAWLNDSTCAVYVRLRALTVYGSAYLLRRIVILAELFIRKEQVQWRY